MTPTTKLEAVNIMLSTIGESPVNSLSSGLVDAEMAETILNSVSRAVQSEGWNFNREFNMIMGPTLDGEIVVPNNTLRADATLSADSKDLVQRGSKMYDKRNHTFKINKDVKLDLVVQLEFEDLPEVEHSPDPDDNPILAAAIATQSKSIMCYCLSITSK